MFLPPKVDMKNKLHCPYDLIPGISWPSGQQVGGRRTVGSSAVGCTGNRLRPPVQFVGADNGS